MPGYADRIVTLPFPELTEEGDETLHVTLRNPKTVPLALLTAEDEPAAPSGAADPMTAMYRIIAGLVLGWRVYDATSVDADQPLLGDPTADNVARLPRVILEAIVDKITEAKAPGAGA